MYLLITHWKWASTFPVTWTYALLHARCPKMHLLPLISCWVLLLTNPLDLWSFVFVGLSGVSIYLCFSFSFVMYFILDHSITMFGFCLVTTCLTSYTPVSCAFSRFSFFLSVSLLCVHVPPVGDCPLASLFPVQLSHVWTLPPACHLLGLLAFMFLN